MKLKGRTTDWFGIFLKVYGHPILFLAIRLLLKFFIAIRILYCILYRYKGGTPEKYKGTPKNFLAIRILFCSYKGHKNIF